MLFKVTDTKKFVHLLLKRHRFLSRSIGDVTDIVEKEIYTFDDRNGENLALRPEGTAGCIRAGIQHGLFYNQIQRLWYMGPFFVTNARKKGVIASFRNWVLSLLV